MRRASLAAALAALLMAVALGRRDYRSVTFRESAAARGRGEPSRRRRPIASTSAGRMLLWSSLAGAAAPAAGMRPLMFSVIDDNMDGYVDMVEFMYNARDELDAEDTGDKMKRRLRFKFYKDLYDFCDVDGDGVLAPRELEYASFLRQMAAERAEILATDMSAIGFNHSEKMIREIDTNLDGAVDMSEFSRATERDMTMWGFDKEGFERPEVKQWLRKLFDGADRDHNGLLEGSEEFRVASFEVFDSMMSITAAFKLRCLDTNNDMRVSWKEVCDASSRGRVAGGLGSSVIDVIRDGFSEADLDGDGVLDSMELYRLSANFMARTRADPS